MLESLTSEKAGKKSLRFDLKEGALQEFETFHKNSFFFPHLLNFSSKWALNRAIVVGILFLYSYMWNVHHGYCLHIIHSSFICMYIILTLFV